MAENKMEQVADLLGIEIDKEFKISGHSAVYILRDDGLYFSEHKSAWTEANTMLLNLLSGKREIVLPPWKPKMGDNYFVPFGVDDYVPEFWVDSESDRDYYEAGLIFATSEEASEMAQKICEFVRKERGLDGRD